MKPTRYFVAFLILACSADQAGRTEQPRPTAAATAETPVTPTARAPDIAKPECEGGTTTKEHTIASGDGLIVHATSSNPCGGKSLPVVVLAHQMCRDRAEWSQSPHDWVSALGARQVATLAIDLRGHGKSTEWPDGSSHDLCEEIRDPGVKDLYVGMVEDVKAAVGWARKELKASRVAIVGSSIGANSALVVAGNDSEVVAAVALSPGMDYRGIRPVPALEQLADRLAILHAAEDDPRSAGSVRQLGKANAKTRIKVWPNGQHGNSMIVAHPQILAELVDQLAARLNAKE